MIRFQKGHRPRPRPIPGVMNKSEADYARELDLMLRAGLIAAYTYDPINLRLADRTYYRPDFLVIAEHVEFHEVKGFWEDDAKVKIKVAAETFPWFIFKAVHKKHGAWQIDEY